MTLALVSAASARPQEYDDYDQQPAPRVSHQKQQNHPHSKNDERETTSHIPIISYDKEQDINGSYKTRFVAY